MWKRCSLELWKSLDVCCRNAIQKNSNRVFAQSGLTQLRLSSSSTNYSNVNVKKKLAPLEPQGPPIAPEGSYFVKKWPDKTKEGVQSHFSMEKLEEYLKEFEEEFDFDNDQPVPNMINPYVEAPKTCVLCQYNVKLDYKNVRLLSQFVSPYTGRIYGRQITGLCIPMQKEIARLIKQSRSFGFMPYTYKKSEYFQDPKIFDPFRSSK